MKKLNFKAHLNFFVTSHIKEVDIPKLFLTGGVPELEFDPESGSELEHASVEVDADGRVADVGAFAFGKVFEQTGLAGRRIADDD